MSKTVFGSDVTRTDRKQASVLRVWARRVVLLALVALASSGSGGCECKRVPSDPPPTDAPAPGASLELRLIALGSNCTPSPGGAGMTGTTITLVRSDGSCAPVTFLRSRGGTQVGSYTVNCASPVLTSCIEINETLSVPRIAPDRYTIHVLGKNGDRDCWSNFSTLEVLPGEPLARDLKLVHVAPC